MVAPHHSLGFELNFNSVIHLWFFLAIEKLLVCKPALENYRTVDKDGDGRHARN